MVNKNYLLSILGGYNNFKVALLIKFVKIIWGEPYH